MHLSPREIEKLMLHNAGFLAQKRYARGLKLNYVETVALLSAQLLEFIREGCSVAELMERGKKLLGFEEVMDGVASMLPEVQVEGTFPDGTKLITVHQPVCRETGEPKLALYGSGLTRLSGNIPVDNLIEEIPGEVICETGDLELNAGRATIELTVLNHGDRPVQVGSHYPFFETNPALLFDRAKAFGKRLNIASGTAIRFEPGESKRVELVDIGGTATVRGGNALIQSTDSKEAALKLALERSFNHGEEA
ncbi:urease subunit gamma [Pontiella agarivorans]|uniref:urease n=1 Tax=Pontiella agarivorans TaxID=3038953 RepID=A0ABU5MWJ3_9BACT|nr:urease subunit gamma [Pontiella agarivorans]MDZ8118548.1 urease subunit gamma [Pontiella agarivorans]